VLWSCKKQSVRAVSTCEAEYCALYDTVRMSQGFGLLEWLLVEKDLPLTFCDSQSALALSKCTLVTRRSKHIDLRLHAVKDHVRDLCYCPTEHNKADMLTKPLCSGSIFPYSGRCYKISRR